MSAAEKFDSKQENKRLFLALKNLKLSLPQLDFAEIIGPNEIIEIYTPEKTLLYRNLEFFHFCGYSLMTIFENKWEDLYAVEQGKELYEHYFDKALEGNTVSLSNNEQWAHIVHEALLETKNRFLIKYKAFIPLLNNETNKVEAVLCISRWQKISKALTPPPPPKAPGKSRYESKDFAKDLMKSLLFDAIYDFLKWIISQSKEEQKTIKCSQEKNLFKKVG